MPQFPFAEKELTGSSKGKILYAIPFKNYIVLISSGGDLYYYTNNMTFIKHERGYIHNISIVKRLKDGRIIIGDARNKDWVLYDKDLNFVHNSDRIETSSTYDYDSINHIIELDNGNIAISFINTVKDRGSICVYNSALTTKLYSTSCLTSYLFKLSNGNYISRYYDSDSIQILDSNLKNKINVKVHPKSYPNYDYYMDQFFSIENDKLFAACRDHTNNTYWVMILDKNGNILEEREEYGYPSTGKLALPNGNIVCYGSYSKQRVVVFISPSGKRIYRYSKYSGDKNRGFSTAIKLDNKSVLIGGWVGNWVLFNSNGIFLASGELTQREINMFAFTSEGNLLSTHYSTVRAEYPWLLSYIPNAVKNIFPKINGNIYQGDKGWVKVNGSLKEIDKIWVKINGELKEV